MRKKELKNIIKVLKKEKELTCRFNPTLEECDYLNSLGIEITKDTYFQRGLISDYKYSIDLTTFKLI